MNKPKYTTEECLKEYYISLDKKLKEKDAMIDWLDELEKRMNMAERWINQLINKTRLID